MISYEPDWDAGTENRYEEHLVHVSSGLCANPWCDDEALPDDDLCADCARELEDDE